MTIQLNYWIYFSIAISFGFVCGIDVDFYDNHDGFFLKSPYHKYKRAEPTVVKESLILTHPAEVYKLRASYGPFEMYEEVPNSFLIDFRKYQETDDDSKNYMHHQIVHNMDVSAHLVNPTISKYNPVVQILVHAQPLVRRRKQAVDLIYSYYGYVQHWCAQVFVSRGSEQFSSVCVLNSETNACVAGISIPDDWWNSKNDTNRSDNILVFYDITRVEKNHECASISNTIVPARPEMSAAAVEKKLISEVMLLDEKLSYVDSFSQDLIFRIPKSDLKSNSQFEVPVVLDKDAAFKEFVIQVTVRGNIEIEGASTDTDSPWNVIFEAGPTKESATITAIIKENLKYSKSFRQEEIMRWQFRVSSEASISPIARITWSVDFERNGLSRNSLYSPEIAKVTAKFNIISGQPEHLTAVLKERNILNTAVLTGKAVVHDLRIYLVSHDNTFTDVTKQSQCRSSDTGVIKVSENCDKVFLDGSEIRGSKNATIFAQLIHQQSAHYMTQINVQVWIPEHRLDIQLSDSKLSQVRGWKIQKKNEEVTKRSVDMGLFTYSDVFPRNQMSPQENCQYKYQQSMIDVYARFVIQPPGETLKYFRNRKIYMRVTDLVKERLHVADSSIAKIEGKTVKGVSPGRTEVQVVSPNGKLMGAKEVRVGKDKVKIERLMVRVISGMSLAITEDRNPGALLATVSLKDLLVAKQQEAVLDIAVEFEDETLLPLTSIDPSEFDLKVISMNPEVVEVTDIISSATLPPSIRAVGNGKGDIIKVTLQENKSCYKKKIKSLDTEYVHVQVDFAKEIDFYNSVQSDGNEVWYGRSDKKEYFKNLQDPYHNKKMEKNSDADVKSGNAKDYLEKGNNKVETLKSSEKSPKSEALQQPVSTAAKHLSPLEIGMYVLIAVFIFAILVFTANCAVFMVRYQRKRSPKGIQRVKTGSISQAPDWVWIGRATLERNGAGSSGCNQALMAEEDFNGNQMVVPNSLTMSVSSQSSGRSQRAEASKCKSGRIDSNPRASSTSGVTGSASTASNRDSMVSTYEGSECSIRITANPLHDDDSGMGYNEAEWDYEAMGMTYEQLMDYFDNLKESSA